MAGARGATAVREQVPAQWLWRPTIHGESPAARHPTWGRFPFTSLMPLNARDGSPALVFWCHHSADLPSACLSVTFPPFLLLLLLLTEPPPPLCLYSSSSPQQCLMTQLRFMVSHTERLSRIWPVTTGKTNGSQKPLHFFSPTIPLTLSNLPNNSEKLLPH